jgi:hypothetical protein
MVLDLARSPFRYHRSIPSRARPRPQGANAAHGSVISRTGKGVPELCHPPFAEMLGPLGYDLGDDARRNRERLAAASGDARSPGKEM